MAQLSSCHSWDSQDSKKPCFLIYSIYWYKDSSLRGNVTSGLRWLWCGILSGRGNRGRVSCKSSFVFLLGLFHKCANHTQPALKFQWRETHMHSDTQPCTRPDEEARCRGRWKLHRCISHTTALWIIELSWLSWSMLLRAHWDPLTRQTLHYTHIHVGFFFFFRMFLQLEQMGLSVVRLSSFLVVLNLNVFVFFADKMEDFSGTFSLLKSIICLFCSTLLSVIQTHDINDEGEWSNYIIIYAMIGRWWALWIINAICLTVLLSRNSEYMYK